MFLLLQDVRMRYLKMNIGLMLMAATLAFIVFLCPKSVDAQDKSALSLMILNTGYSLEVEAGNDNHFPLEVRNLGTTTFDNIRLSSDMVGGWIIEFTPVEIQSLSPGSVQIIDVNIRPSSNLSEKVHYIRLFATSGAFQTVQSYQLEVKTAPIWLWVVIVVAIVAATLFVFIYLRMGRRG